MEWIKKTATGIFLMPPAIIMLFITMPIAKLIGRPWAGQECIVLMLIHVWGFYLTILVSIIVYLLKS
jgi:hypothetical protein